MGNYKGQLRARLGRGWGKCALAAPCWLVAGAALAGEPIDHVDPFIGTDDAQVSTPVPGGSGGSVFPGPALPFGMVQLSPDTPTASPSGYRRSDQTIEDFSFTHFSGAGCANNEALQLLPFVGPVERSPGSDFASFAATKSNEAAAPGYYATTLNGVTRVELTATQRAGALRIRFPASERAQLLINASRNATGQYESSLELRGRELSGTLSAGKFCGQTATYPIYFALRVDRDPVQHAFWQGGAVSEGATRGSGTQAGVYLSFDTRLEPVVNVVAAISYVSVENARLNLDHETGAANFDQLQAAARDAWRSQLGRVSVGAAEPEREQTKFYTALYHSFLHPNVASDVSGEYRGFDQQIHMASHVVYQNYSGWDIYRAWVPLMSVLAPEVMTDVVRSLVLDGQAGGLLPMWSQQSVERFVMTGDPGPIVVASAHAFGVHDFDQNAALSLMKKSVEGAATQGQAIRERALEHELLGYVIGDASESLEYAASDFAMARFAAARGDGAFQRSRDTAAARWRSSWDPDASYISARGLLGTFPFPLDPAANTGFVEGNAAQYTWMVPYDYETLFRLMGGRDVALSRLQAHFAELNAGLSTTSFYIGNEPEHGVPWAYHFAGKPARTSETVARIMDSAFDLGAGGLPGNDDLGATSAWYVWAALGLYPVTPGTDTLAVHMPRFSQVRIARSSGDIVINATGVGSYIDEVRRDGIASTRSYLRFAELANGAQLEIRRAGSESAWGTRALDLPPSYDGGVARPVAGSLPGTNVALGKATSGSAPCSASEAAERAVDGSLRPDSHWCAKGSAPQLVVDLGRATLLQGFVLAHAGLGGASTSENLTSYRIETSVDGATWTTRSLVQLSHASRTRHPIAPTPARYVRLTAFAPLGVSSFSAKLQELEVYGDAN